MNKVVNVISIIATALYLYFAVGVVYDFSISSLHIRNVALGKEILWGLAILLGFVNALRATRRWQGIRDMKKFTSFSYRKKLSKSALQMAIIHTGLEILFIVITIFSALRFLMLEPKNAYPILIVGILILLESLVFFVRRMKNDEIFGIGINKEVLAVFNREMQLYYFLGLRRVELHGNAIHFAYKGDLSLFLPTDSIIPGERVSFRNHLIDTLSNHNVFIDEGFRKWE